MRKNLEWLILAACVLLPLFAGWLIPRPSPVPNGVNSRGQTAPNRASVGEPAVQKSLFQPAPLNGLPRESPLTLGNEPPKPRAEVQPADGNATFTNLESPNNSQDLNQNREWARKFPVAALAWAQNATNGPQRDAIAEIVCPQLAQTNPAAAVLLAENCLDSATNDVVNNLLDNLAQTWAGQNVQDAYNWASAMPQGEERNRLLGRIAFVQANSNPQTAAQLVAEQMTPGEIQNEAAISVLHQWALQNASAALAWAQAFPAGDFRERAIKEVNNTSAVALETKPAD